MSPCQNYYQVTVNDVTLIMAGLAYNPFSMIFDENLILSSLGKEYSKQAVRSPSSSFWSVIHELTGIFTIIIIDGDSIYVMGDASGIQTTFYTSNTGKIYISSHTNLIGDLLGLKRDPYVKKLRNYRFFKLLGNALPGDLTPFKEVKRLIPNHYLKLDEDGTCEEKRFYLPRRLELSEKEIAEQGLAADAFQSDAD